MSNRLFYATPDASRPVPGQPLQRTGLAGMRWEAWDGTSWDLLDAEAGLFLTEGVRGLHFPAVSRQTSTSPRGTRYLDHYIEEREVFWPLFLFADGDSQAWVEADRRFHRGLRPDKVGRWVVMHPNGTERSLRLRFTPDGNHAYLQDPTRSGWAVYGLTFAAESPLWEGPAVTRAWRATEPKPFFGTDGLNIASSSTLSSARIRNVGDVDAWPVWTVEGPTTSVSVGVGADRVEIPFALGDGDVLTIDTDPEVQTAVMADGTERTGELGAVDFAAIPADATAELNLSMVGSGIVRCSLTPLYYKAW